MSAVRALLVIFPVPVLAFAGVKVQELCISFLLNNLIIFVVNSSHTSHIIRVRFTQFIIVSPYKAFDTYKFSFSKIVLNGPIVVV